jgi:septal ring factor EnvC (AmiA/AmiB activator)
MIKKISIALAIPLILLIIMICQVWRAETAPIYKTPGALETGRTQIHAQLLQIEQKEAQFEKQYWNSIDDLHALISSHEQRIAQLSSNKEAGEIVAHDQQAIARLEKRITDIEAQNAARAAALAAQAEAQEEDSANQTTQATPQP